MQDDVFEWDDAKARGNIARHDLSFETARKVFRDPFALEWMDDREDHGEARFVVLGMASHRLLCVAYSMRGGRIRIISARGANPHERRAYHEGRS